MSREREALALLDTIYNGRTKEALLDDEMFVNWMDEQIAAFIAKYGPLGRQLREMQDESVLDVYGTAEAMALLGVQKSQFHVLARTAGFPRPARIRWPGWETDARLAATPLYDGPEMREYAANRKSG